MNQVSDFNEFVLTQMPTFIAINYQRLLEAQDPQEQVKLILHIYNLGLRVLTINLVSQYIFRDRALKRVSDSYLDTLLEQRFPHLTADAWKEMLFTTLRAYEGHRDLFFMPELYDFYWGTSTSISRGREYWASVKRKLIAMLSSGLWLKRSLASLFCGGLSEMPW